MTEPNQKDENIVIRTMKSDLEDLNNPRPKKEKEPIPIMPAGSISKEAQYKVSQAPILPPLPKMEEKTRPPILVVPQKIIPPKEIPEIPTKPIYKATPALVKLGAIGLGMILIAIFGLYGYWKIFIQTEPPAPPVITPNATTTIPGFPITPSATTTTPIKFFNKLPHKTVTIDLSSKTPIALISALKSEATVSETRASVKQIKVTYLGKPITVQEFFDLMSIFAPQNLMSNYEDEFTFTFFYHLYQQKNEVRPILILKTKNRDLAQTQLQDWEKTSLISDTYPLFLLDFKLPTVKSFKSYLFINQPVRYLNVNIPYASLSYSIYNDFVILSTSSAGMFVILQDLTGQSISADYLKRLEASLGNLTR
ncbi:MAG: hypothetical protein Q7K16_01285 [Candidatus Azambacteria bacterium]|nr:hypothetical protein [Candidatus Azambacteria bacterium]